MEGDPKNKIQKDVSCPPFKNYKIKLEDDSLKVEVKDEPEDGDLNPIVSIFLPGLPLQAELEDDSLKVEVKDEPEDEDLKPVVSIFLPGVPFQAEGDVEVFEAADQPVLEEEDVLDSFEVKKKKEQELDTIATQVANVSIKNEPDLESDETLQLDASFEMKFEFEENWNCLEEPNNCNVGMLEDIEENRTEDSEQSEPLVSRLACPLCPAQLKSTSVFQDHFLKTHEDFLYCLKCKLTFKKADSVKLEMHSAECCELGNPMFSDTEHSESDDENFQNSKAHHCQLCGGIFADSKTIAEHFLCHHSKFIYCPKCKIILKVKDREKLVEHSDSCCKIPLQNITQLYCDICFSDQTFKTVRALNIHKHFMHDFVPEEMQNSEVDKRCYSGTKNSESKGTCTSTDNPLSTELKISQAVESLKSKIIDVILKWMNIVKSRLPTSMKNLKIVVHCPTCEIDFPHTTYVTTHLKNFPQVHCRCPFCGMKAPTRQNKMLPFLLHVSEHYEDLTKLAKCQHLECSRIFFNTYNCLVHAKNRHESESAKQALKNIIKQNELKKKVNALKRKAPVSSAEAPQAKRSLISKTTSKHTNSSVPNTNVQFTIKIPASNCDTSKPSNSNTVQEVNSRQILVPSHTVDVTSFRFSGIKNLINSLKVYYESQPVSKSLQVVVYCPVCMQDVPADSYFNSHIEDCVQNNQLTCPFCALSVLLNKRHSLEAHIQPHFPQKVTTVQCTPCKFLFLNAHNYSVHAKLRHDTPLSSSTDISTTEVNPTRLVPLPNNVTHFKFKTIKEGREKINTFCEDLRNNYMSSVQQLVVHCASCSTDMIYSAYFASKHFEMCRNKENKFSCSFCIAYSHKRAQQPLARLNLIGNHLSSYKAKIICNTCNLVFLSSHNIHLHNLIKHGDRINQTTSISQSSNPVVSTVEQPHKNISMLISNVVNGKVENINLADVHDSICDNEISQHPEQSFLSNNLSYSVAKESFFDPDEIINHIYDELRKYKSYSSNLTYVIYCINCSSSVLVDTFFKTHVAVCMPGNFHCPFCKIILKAGGSVNEECRLQHMKKHVLETRIMHLSCSCNYVFINSSNRMAHMTAKNHILPKVPPIAIHKLPG